MNANSSFHAFKPVSLAYCDYIADRIRTSLENDDPARLIARVGRVHWDLDPEGGWLVSTKKTMHVTDRNGKSYRVTVEEMPRNPAAE